MLWSNEWKHWKQEIPKKSYDSEYNNIFFLTKQKLFINLEIQFVKRTVKTLRKEYEKKERKECFLIKFNPKKRYKLVHLCLTQINRI